MPVFDTDTDTEQAALLDVRDVAAMLNCSTRHVYRLADAGKLPRPVKLGAIVRWPRAELNDWLVLCHDEKQGCPSRTD